MSFSIGNIKLKHGIMLAPMAGFSDGAMRQVCRRMGAEYSVTEMVSAKAVCFGDKKTITLAAIREEEGPVGLQIFGKEPGVMARAAELLAGGSGEGFVPPASIDINMGCPVHKIFGNGEGSALMRSPELIYRIVRSVFDASPIPVTVKLRLGVDSEHKNAIECALAAEEGGASMICLHGRTRVEMYSGSVDMDAIRDVKHSLHIPLVANGDIRSGADAIEMLRYTSADGIAIGRGAVGNPYIFDEITCALEGREYIPPSRKEIVETALLQLSLSVEQKGERLAVPEARKQIASYLHGFRGSAAIRAEINQANSYALVEEILKRLLDEKTEEIV